MQQDDASFWSDIKVLDARLADNPGSYCFARLAEVYLKVGLLDDALHTAQQGIARYPRYLAGQRILAMACHAKGLKEQCISTLELLTEALPEDAVAQKMLAQMYAESGNDAAAVRCLQTVLEFTPDDSECRTELDLLQRSEPISTSAFTDSGSFGDELDQIEEIGDEDILDIDEMDLVEEEVYDDQQPESDLTEFEPTGQDQDPLFTVTLAELYVSQGFTDKAREIYLKLLADDPTNSDLQSRITQISPSDSFSVPVEGVADNSVELLSGWLDNIRRIKACR